MTMARGLHDGAAAVTEAWRRTGQPARFPRDGRDAQHSPQSGF